MKKMMKLLMMLGALLICPPTVTHALDRSFAWSPNTESDLAGYKIHYGAASGEYDITIDVLKPDTNSDGQVTTTIDIPNGDWYVSATAYDSAGFESGYSDEVHLTHIPPSAIQNFKSVTITFNADGSVTVTVNQ